MDDRDWAGSAATDVAVSPCLGWSVSSPDGRLGVVERLLLDRGGCIAAVDVRCGLFHARHELIGVEDVLQVDAERRRLVVRAR
jgi:hypothetical protein